LRHQGQTPPNCGSQNGPAWCKVIDDFRMARAQAMKLRATGLTIRNPFVLLHACVAGDCEPGLDLRALFVGREILRLQIGDACAAKHRLPQIAPLVMIVERDAQTVTGVLPRSCGAALTAERAATSRAAFSRAS
jgi:hypothetical protein